MSMRFPTIDPIATGKNIARLRNQRGLTVKDLQEYFGFEEPRAIYKWQRGQSLPSVDNLFALGAILQVSLDEILIPCEQCFSIISTERQDNTCRSASLLDFFSASRILHFSGKTDVCFLLARMLFVHEKGSIYAQSRTRGLSELLTTKVTSVRRLFIKTKRKSRCTFLSAKARQDVQLLLHGNIVFEKEAYMPTSSVAESKIIFS